MRFVGTAALALTGWTVISQNAAAQTPEPMRVLFGVSLGGMRTSHPEGGIADLGGLLGVERTFAGRHSVRVLATLDHGVSTTDDIALCHPTTSGCLPDAVFPSWLWGARLEGAMSVSAAVPVRLVFGAGVSLATKPQEADHSAVPLKSVSRASWRGGVEVPLGRSRSAPVLQVGRTGFVNAPYSLSAIDAVTIVLRR